MVVEADWTLGPVKPTATRAYGGKVGEIGGIDISIVEGTFEGWDLHASGAYILDREWIFFLPDNFYISDVDLTAPARVGFSTGTIGSLGSIDFTLLAAKGKGHYLTMLPGINAGTNPAIEEDRKRYERVVKAAEPYRTNDQFDGERAAKDPEFMAALSDYNKHQIGDRLQGLFSIKASSAEFQLFDYFRFSVSGTEESPGFLADYSIDYDPIDESDRLLDNRAYISLNNVALDAAFEGIPLFSVRSASEQGNPAIEIRSGNWGLQPDDPLFSIDQLTGSLTLFPFQAADESVVYPRITLTKLEVQQDYDWTLDKVEVAIPNGAFSSIGLGGILPLDIESLEVDFGTSSDGSLDLKNTTVVVAGKVNQELLEQQLRQLTQSPNLTLSLYGWSGPAGMSLITPGKIISAAFRLDASTGGLRILNGPALRLDLDGLLLPTPGGDQASFSGSLILGGTDYFGNALMIPAGLLVDAGVADLLPSNFGPTQVLLAGTVRSADGLTSVAAVLSGGLRENILGSRLDLDGQLRLEGGLLSDALNLEGAVEAALSWRLETLRGPSGQLEWKGFPTIEGIGLQNVGFEVPGVLRIQLDQLAWTATPRQDDLTGLWGLVARARGLSLEVLEGALRGQTFRTGSAEVLLFDLNEADGVPDHFYIEGLDLALSEVTLGPLQVDGLRLKLGSLTNLPAPDGGTGMRGAITLEADQARLQVGEVFRGAILPPELPADTSSNEQQQPPALQGSFDLTSGDLSLSLQRFEAALSLGGQEIFSLEASNRADAAALKLVLDASAGADEAVVSIPALLGAMPLLAVDTMRGRLSPSLQVDGLAIQNDGDVELGAISLSLPEGFGHQWNLGGLVPMALQELSVRFDSRPDGSADLSHPLLSLRGQLDADWLEKQLQQLLDAPALEIRLGRYGVDGQLQTIEGSADISLDARIDTTTGNLLLLNSPGWRVQIDALPLPVPGITRPLLAGDLLLPGTDAEGDVLALPSELIRSLASSAGVSEATTLSLIERSPQVVGLLKGSLQLEDGLRGNLFSAESSLLLGGSLGVGGNGISVLRLAGEAELSPALRIAGLSASAGVSTGFNWDLISTPQANGAIKLDGALRLTGAGLSGLHVGVDGLLDLRLQSMAWFAEPQIDRVGTEITSGLVARAKGLSLEVLLAPMAGLQLGSADSEVRLYDLDYGDGLVDRFYLTGEAFALTDLDLGWLKAERAALELQNITDLEVLDPSPGDGNPLSGVIELAMETASVGSDLRWEGASGRYDLSSNTLELSLKGLNWSRNGVTLQGGGQLRLDPRQPADRWLQIQAEASLQTGLPGLASLQGGVELDFNEDLSLSKMEATLSAAISDRWLGDLELLGDLHFAYEAALNQASLTGNVRLAGIDAAATIRFRPGEQAFEASLRISNQNTLQLADWLELRPSELDLLYTYNPQQGGRLDLDGLAGLTLLGNDVDVSADLQVGFSGANRQAQILGGDIQLINPLEGVTIAGFRVDLIPDRSGQLPGIHIGAGGDPLMPSLSGAVRFKDLQDLTVQLDPSSGAIAYSSIGWSFERFDIDLTPSGPLDLGLLELGDNASLRYADETFTLNPDLSVNAVLLGNVLAPVAKVVDHTITPLTQPVVELLLNELPLGLLNDLDGFRPDWVWDWTWSPISNAGRDIYSSLLTFFEGTPGNPYRDGKLQVVELLDSCSYFFFRLLKENPALGRVLADEYGLPAEYVKAVIDGAPFIPLGSSIRTLETINQLAIKVRQAEASSSDQTSGDRVRIPDLSLRFRPSAIAETVGSIRGAASADSPIIQALLDVQKAWQSSDTANGTTHNGSHGSSLFNVDVDLGMSLIDDPLNSLLALLKGQPLDLIRLDFGLDANLSFEANQSFTIPFGGVPLPLVVGAQARLDGQLNASLGLTTDSTSLLQFKGMLTGGRSPLDAVGQLLAPVDREGLGVYLSGLPDQPLLRLDPMVRVQGGLDAGVAGLRAFVGVQGALDVQLGAERLYLGNLVRTLTSDSPPTAQDLARLFSFDANLSALFGVDGKIFDWYNILSSALPLYSLSVPRVSSGPVINGEVLFDTRRYDANKSLVANVNLDADSGEFIGRTDSQGAYRFAGSPDPTVVGNRDGVLDFRDGMVIAGQRNGQVTGQRISLVDSISGVDLGIPLVGLPGGPITTITTLKYTNLLRWTPNRMIAGRPSTPELISEIYASIIKDVPDAFLDDSLEPYQLIASADEQKVRQGMHALAFGYQHLSAVLMIKSLLTTFRLDYLNQAAWGFKPQPGSIDAPELVAFGAYGLAIRSLFGPVNQDGINPLDPKGRRPIAANYDVTNPGHLRAVVREILATYPTKRLFDAAQELDLGKTLVSDFIADGRTTEQQARIDALIDATIGYRLDNIAEGLAAITQTIQSRLREIQKLDSVIPIPGPQLVAAAIAGPKRHVISSLVPSLIELSGNPNRDQFRAQFFSLFYTPTTIDPVDRQQSFLIKVSTSATAIIASAVLDRSSPRERVSVSIRLADQNGSPIEAPDYGLTIRFRLGGTAQEGIHYILPAANEGNLAYVQPGASSTTLELNLLPYFFSATDSLLQIELLSADSGFEVDPQAAVVSLGLHDTSTSALDGARHSFKAQGLVRGLPRIHNQLIAAAGQRNAVLRGVNGQADTFVLRPQSDALPHLENFRPQEGDQLLVDPEALRRLRLTPGRRNHDPEIRTEAYRQLLVEKGAETLAGLSESALATELERVMNRLDPLPEPRLEQLNTLGGFLFDLVSKQPLALLSDQDAQGRDLAWSSLSTDSRAGSIGWLPTLAPKANDQGTLTLENPSENLSRIVLMRATLSQRPATSSQVVMVVLEASELEGAEALLADPAVLSRRAQPLFTSLEATDVFVPDGLTFDREITLKVGQSLRFYEIRNGDLQVLSSHLRDGSQVELLKAGASNASDQAVVLSSSSGMEISLVVQDNPPSLDALISNNAAALPLLDFTGLDPSTSLNGRVTLAREADYDAITGFYRALDHQGSVRSVDGLNVIRPDDPGYAAAALALSNIVPALSDLKVGDEQTTVREFNLSGAGVLAPYARVNGHTFFAFGAANPDGISHFSNLGVLSFGLEDMLGGGDNDKDDLLMSFSFTYA